jgi:hypothetical protein
LRVSRNDTLLPVNFKHAVLQESWVIQSTRL